jgi:uncharacterized membrane protein
LLTPAQVVRLEQLLRAQLAWRPWVEKVLLFLGAALLLAGVIFFFAYNWNALSAFQKFALVEGAIVGCAVGAWWFGLETLAGKVGVLAASVLTGVFLAVFGQIYQTGADSYELFSGWALLILPWVLLARFGALWILWLLLVNTGLILFWGQSSTFQRLGFEHFADFATLLAIFNSLMLAAREVAVRFGRHWLREGWLRTVILVPVFVTLTSCTCFRIIDGAREGSLIAPAVLLGAAALGYWIYRNVLPSVFVLAVIAMSLCTVLVVLVGHAILDQVHDPIGSFFLMGIITLAIFGAAIFWLRMEARQLAGHSEPEEWE